MIKLNNYMKVIIVEIKLVLTSSGSWNTFTGVQYSTSTNHLSLPKNQWIPSFLLVTVSQKGDRCSWVDLSDVYTCGDQFLQRDSSSRFIVFEMKSYPLKKGENCWTKGVGKVMSHGSFCFIVNLYLSYNTSVPLTTSNFECKALARDAGFLFSAWSSLYNYLYRCLRCDYT